ncbi:MAG TPA: DUF2238 domain-containing protein [Burkholderiaceae bacterium]|jgi:putative membrane protein|nr:DUF2238 domain-containing protein [Burkholderiaceae bacterium]
MQTLQAARRTLLLLAVAFGAWWLALAIAPLHRDDWALENVLVVVCVVAVAATYRRWPLSPASYMLLFVFLCMHEIGAHYTYSEVPYDAWFQAVTGTSLNSLMGWERNHFDRLGHFLYGLLLAYPVREIILRATGVRGFWSYFFPVEFIVASSALYEMFEWAAAVYFGGDLGVAYLGTQGDVWDAQRDMVLASLGGLLAMLGAAVWHRMRGRDGAQQWLRQTTSQDGVCAP